MVQIWVGEWSNHGGGVVQPWWGSGPTIEAYTKKNDTWRLQFGDIPTLKELKRGKDHRKNGRLNTPYPSSAVKIGGESGRKIRETCLACDWIGARV